MTGRESEKARFVGIVVIPRQQGRQRILDLVAGKGRVEILAEVSLEYRVE